MLHSPKPMNVGTVLRNRYKISQFLGSGGFGDTYLAQDLDLPGHPNCVVKQLKPKNPEPSILQTARVLFDREAKVLYSLGNAHDQIPRLFAHFEEKGEFYLVQEYVSGCPLSQELIAGQPWDEPKVTQLLREILEVLAVVHQHGVIHRDIKPPNLMRRAQDQKIVLIDFGAVKEISALALDGQGHTTSTIAIGSLGYMPPEQAHGNPQRASDIYAVGVLGIQALLGRIPQQDLSTGDLIWKTLVSVSPQFANALDMMTRYHFRDRYQSAELALAALTPTHLSQPTPPPSNPELESTLLNPRPPHWPKSKLDTTVVTPRPQPTEPSASKPTSYRWLMYGCIGVISASLVFLLGYLTIGSHQNSQANEYIEVVKRQYKKQTDSAAVNGLVRIFEFNANYVIADDSRGSNYRDQGKLDEVLEKFNKAIELDPKNAAYYNDRGTIYYDQNKQSEALDDFNKAIDLDSTLAAAYNNRAYVYYNQKKQKEALDDFNKAIELEPKLAVAYNGRGVIYSDQNDNQKALDDYNQATKIDPQYAVAYHNKGAIYLAQEKLDDSLPEFNTAIKLEPRLAISYYMRSTFYSTKGKQSEALDDLNKAIELDPKLEVAYYDRGFIYYDKGNQQKAIDDLSKSIELDPGFANAYLGRGNIYYNENNQINALNDYNKAINIDPKLASAYLGRGNVYYYQNRYNDALGNYSKAIELNTQLANAFYGRGNVYSVLKNNGNAIADYQKAADLYKAVGKTKDYQDALKRIKELQE